MSVQRPSFVINLKLKFDESLTVHTEADAESVDQFVADPIQTLGDLKKQPLITQLGDDNVTFVMARIPKSATMEKAGYRLASKWSAEFDFKDLPIDPRTVSAASVEIHIGSISDKDFAQGMRGRDSSGRFASVLRTRTDEGTPNSETMRLLGTVDEWKVSHDNSGSVVRMSGRDLRGILLDTPINIEPGAQQHLLDNLDLDQPITIVVAQILAFNPFFQEINVLANPEDWPDQTIPHPSAPDLIPRHRKGARKQKKGGRSTPNARSSGTKLNFWALIVRFCYLVGAIPYFDHLGQLVIRPSSSIYDQVRAGVDPEARPTPFMDGQRRALDSITGKTITPPLSVRRLVYGRDVEKLEFFRKFGGQRRPKTVRAISLDPDSTQKGAGKMLVGIWPPRTENKARKTKRASGKQGPMEEVINVPVPGIRDIGRLTEIAHSIYEEMGRGEMGGSIETTNLSSFGGGQSDPDLLRLDPGDGIELFVDTRAVSAGSPLTSTLTDSERLSFDDQVARIEHALGGGPDLARVIVATARGQIGELQRFFRVQNVKYNWSDKGIKIAFDYQNYIVATSQIGTASTLDGEKDTKTIGTKNLVDPVKPSIRS